MIKNVIQSSSSSELIEIMTTNNCQNDLFNHSNKHNDHSLLMNGFIHKMRERTKIFPNIYDYEVKVIILGERRVGKSRFMYRLQHDKFLASDAKNDDFGFGLCSKIVINQRRQYVKGVIWSCSFESSAYFKNADGVILMFDLTRKSSFDDLYKSVHKMKEFCIPNVKCILLYVRKSKM
ncbi:hypothetical protein C9374_013320 [Naegleria lovaniensis]|uniref:Uncharacterized protein n=1 Tax=Naegleria lovaniensis TaxID=51637 RepID=A0AA88GVP9_NAELO|nr:uncharacterized protein C9374_013320 [Naegleria lovaniensis]KAG2391835.1 hypothetical protein C9374_013320 [Naegleria lovaniensis]